MARPGRRGPADGRKVRGTTGDDHQVWLEIGTFRHSLFLYEEGASMDVKGEQVPVTAENGPSLIYRVLGPGGSRVGLDLTNLTHEELVKFREFWQMAFELAEPVVLLRDKEAEDAFREGDDSFTRIHRAVPRLIVRARALRAHRQIVQLGLEAAVAGGWDLFRRVVRAGGDGDAVADSAPRDAQAQDDNAQADQPASVRSMGGAG